MDYLPLASSVCVGCVIFFVRNQSTVTINLYRSIAFAGHTSTESDKLYIVLQLVLRSCLFHIFIGSHVKLFARGSRRYWLFTLTFGTTKFQITYEKCILFLGRFRTFRIVRGGNKGPGSSFSVHSSWRH